jgi:hypothetical protein
MEADVQANDMAPEIYQKKHVTNVKWTPAKATIGIGMGNGMYTWIRDSFDKGYAYKNGTLVAGDFDFKAQSRLDFQNALITSVTFPKLDGASKDAAYFDIEFDTEQVTWMRGDGSSLQAQVGAKQKAWLCSNFAVVIGALPCTRVSTVDSFSWKQAVTADYIGQFVLPTKHPAKVTVPTVKLGISMADFDPWADAAKKWFIDGQHLESDEMTGSIKMLGPDMQQSLGEIDLANVGFQKFSPEDLEANSEKIARFSVEMYIESMKFNIQYYDA